MPTPATTVTAYFDLSATGGDFFTLNDPTKGELDNVTYTLAGDIATDITADTMRVSVRRGRDSQLFEDIPAGTASVQLQNRTRTYDPNYASSPYVGNVRPGKRVNVASAGVSIFDGIVADWNLDYEVGGMSLAFAECVDALGQLGRMELDAWTATASQTAGPRIEDVLDRPEVAFTANRSIDTGVSVLQGDSVTWSSNVLNYLQLVTRSDLGWFYASRTGVVTFRDRLDPLNVGIAVTFADDGTGVPFQGIAMSYGSELLYNRVGIDRENGTLQTVTDAASQALYGASSLSERGLLLDSDTQSLDMANYLLGIYSDPELRVAALTVELAALDPTQQASVLGLDIASVISVTWTPNGVGLTGDEAALEILQDSEFWIDANIDDLPARVSSSLTRSCIVEGIAHDITPDSHTVTLSLGDADRRSFLQLDDPIFGTLDHNVLAF
jgi:hypothetical protein